MRAMLAALILFCGGSLAVSQETGVLPVGVCEIDGNDVHMQVTFHNFGKTFSADYTAFVHFDRSLAGESLYAQAAPGLRPLVAQTDSSTWQGSDTITVGFDPVTIPAWVAGAVYVKVGLFDAAGSGPRISLLGKDSSQRVLVGRLQMGETGWEWVRERPRDAVAVERVGARPRAFVKAMPDPPTVRFGDVRTGDWEVESLAGGSAELQRTREELCWSEASLKVTYAGSQAGSGFVLRPRVPLVVPEDADIAALWLLGRAAAWTPKLTAEEPLLVHWLEMADGQGAVHHLRFPNVVGYPYWYVARARTPREWPRPLTCTGLGFAGCTNTLPRSFLLDALVFAPDMMAPTLETRVDITRAGFPTSADGLLPEAPRGEGVNEVLRVGAEFVLRYTDGEERLEYHYTPRTGGFDDLAVVWTQGRSPERFSPAAGGGVILELAGKRYSPGAPGTTLICTDAEMVAGVVVVNWKAEAAAETASYTLRLGLRGRSMLLEIDAADEHTIGIDAGHMEGLSDARFVPFPYWTWNIWDSGRDGGVVVSPNLFVSGYPDWYRSRATALTFGSGVSHRIESLTDAVLDYVPGVAYARRSDGERNRLRERYVFTVSPDVLEVLPSIPHQASPGRETLASLCHSTGGQASRLEEQLTDWRRLAAYGVTDVYIRHFDGMWSDLPQGPQEWTLTEHAAPVVGDAVVRDYLDELRHLGFTPVLYTNYTDLQPVAEAFDWEHVIRLANGDISPDCWPGSYPLKPLKAVELQRHYAPRIASRFGTTGSFCDVHTAIPPWGRVDADARLPGAAMFGTTYRSYGMLLGAERDTYGSVYSEGSMHWLYAGLADGSDAELDAPHPFREPFLVDFDLRKIHPLEMDAGMSWIHRYIKTSEEAAFVGGWEAAQDRFTAATLAFGHQGTFTQLSFRGCSADVKTYYMLRPLQTLYAMRRATEILYHHAATGAMEPLSAALHSGSYRNSQVNVRYETGLRLWVNGSFTDDWDLRAGEGNCVLPPAGFVALGPAGLRVASCRQGTGRADLATYDGIVFADARGQTLQLGPFLTDGAALLRQHDARHWTLHPMGDMTVLRLTLPHSPVAVVGVDEYARPMERVTVEAMGDVVDIPPDMGAFGFDIDLGAMEPAAP